MQNVQTNLLLRDDTFLGVCEALGEDFRINANILRVALGVSLLWNPVAVIGIYLGAGVLVAVSRLIVRNPRPAATTEPAAASEAVAAPEAAPEPALVNDNANAMAVAA